MSAPPSGGGGENSLALMRGGSESDDNLSGSQPGAEEFLEAPEPETPHRP